MTAAWLHYLPALGIALAYVGLVLLIAGILGMSRESGDE